MSDPITDYFAAKYAAQYGVDADLIRRLIAQESGGNQEAVSSRGAIGVMQLMPGTAKELGVNPYDVRQNIEGGVRYLKQQLDQFGDVELALAAYNAGPNAVKLARGIPNIPETKKYVAAIAGNDDPVAEFLKMKRAESKSIENAQRDAVTKATALDQGTVGQFLQSKQAKGSRYLPAHPDPADQAAAQFEVLKKSGQLGQLQADQVAQLVAPLVKNGWEVGHDYIKPPDQAPGKYPLWETQLAEQGRAPAQGVPQTIGHGAEIVAQESGFPTTFKGIVDLLTNLDNPVRGFETLKGMGEAQLAEYQQARDLAKEKKLGGRAALSDPEVATHFIGSLVPFFGPMGVRAVERAKQGDVIGAYATVAAGLGAVYGPKLLGKVFPKGPIAETAGQRLNRMVRGEEPGAAPAVPETPGERLARMTEVQNAKAVREDQGQLREAGPAPQEGQGTRGTDLYQGRERRVEVQSSEVAPQGEISNVEKPIPETVRPQGAAGAETQTPQAPPQTEGAPQAEVGQRAFQRTAEAAGFPKGRDLTYDIIHNDAAIEAADRNLTTKGIDGSIEFVKQSEPSAEATATGLATIRALQDAGDYARAGDLVDTLATKLTQQGQAIQAVKIIENYAPERAALTAQKILDRAGKGRRLTPIEVERFTELSKGLQAANDRVATLEQRVDKLQSQVPRAQGGGAGRVKVQNWRASLDQAAEQARMRIKARTERGRLGPEAGESPLIGDVADYATIGAAKLARVGIDFATWTAEMISEFGDSIRPHLDRIYRASFDQYKTARDAATEQAKVRGVTRAKSPIGPFKEFQVEGPPTPEVLRTAMQQRDLAIKMQGKARRALAREYDSLQPGRRLVREVVSAINLPRAIVASLDLSATLRQGKILIADNPLISARAFAAQLKALGTKGYEAAYTTIRNNSEFKEAQASGVEFTGGPLRTGVGLSAGEEAFMTRWAEKVPGIKQSEQAYTTYLDTLRMQVFEKYAKEARKAVADPKKLNAEMKNIAKFINNATGRGSLGRAGNAAAPILNTVFFSPRYAISRMRLLNPVGYMKMTPFARRIAARAMVKYLGLVGITVGLAKAAGLNVGSDPTSADFLKIRAGNTRLDLFTGFQQYVVAGSRIMQAAYLNAKGRGKDDTGYKEKAKQEITDTLIRFARGKLAPGPSAAADVFVFGKTFTGEPATAREEAKRLAPLVAQDIYQAWKDEHTPLAMKIAGSAGSFFGEGVQTYENKRADPPVFKKLSFPDALTAYREARKDQQARLRGMLRDKLERAKKKKTPSEQRALDREYRAVVQ